MAYDVEWIKQYVGMFDGMSFKKIKKAKINDKSIRDKLTAVWFELLDLAGKCNHDGALYGDDVSSFSDIATMIDRDEDELNVCMDYFMKERMITFSGEIYAITKWSEYQNIDGLEKIRESKRLAQARWREKKKAIPESSTVDSTVDSTVESRRISVDDAEEDKEGDIRYKNIDYKEIVSLFSSICVSFPSVRTLSDSRKKAIRARLNTYSIDDFKTMFQKAEASDFLKGNNDRNWQANFDWLIKDSNFAKVLEGNYDNKEKRYTRKEPVPGWVGFQPGEAELEAVQRVLKEPAVDDP